MKNTIVKKLTLQGFIIPRQEGAAKGHHCISMFVFQFYSNCGFKTNKFEQNSKSKRTPRATAVFISHYR